MENKLEQNPDHSFGINRPGAGADGLTCVATAVAMLPRATILVSTAFVPHLKYLNLKVLIL